MPDHDQQEPQLKVSDRRKFTTSGERRPGADIDEEPQRAAPPPDPPSAAPILAAAPPAAPVKPQPQPAPRQERLAGREVTFAALLDLLYGNGLMFLGLAAPPGEQPRLELEGARETIDMIGMLQTKTHGNLTPEESETLNNILYDLRMAYMEVAKAAAGPRGAQPTRR